MHDKLNTSLCCNWSRSDFSINSNISASKIVFNFFLIKFDLVVFLLLAVSSRFVVVVIVVVLELFVWFEGDIIDDIVFRRLSIRTRRRRKNMLLKKLIKPRLFFSFIVIINMNRKTALFMFVCNKGLTSLQLKFCT